MPSKAKWYSVRAAAPSAAEVLIYGDIGESWNENTVTARDFVREIGALDVDNLTVRINSFGGSVPDGVAIYNALRRHRAAVTITIDGVAASIASLIAMAGDQVEMAASALMMIHAPWVAAFGNSAELREQADMLDQHADAMSTCYAEKTGRPRGEMLELLTDGMDHWFTADEALAEGFINAIVEPLQLAASIDLSIFPTLPARLRTVATAFGAAPTREGHTMRVKVPGSATANAGSTDESVRAAAIAADGARRREIRSSFAPFASYSGVAAVREACEDDPECTPEVAGARLLAHIGRDATPVLGARNVPRDGLDVRARGRDLREAQADALLMRNGIRVQDPSPLARDFENTSVVDMARMCLERRGVPASGLSPARVVSAAFAASTSSDFPLLLADVAGKSMRAGYEAEGATLMWTADREVRDFKLQSLVALSAAPGLLEVPEGGEYKHGAFGESAESFRVKTYGRIFALTRQAIVNDDLGAFTQLPLAFGRAARRHEADLVYAKLTGSDVLSDGVVLFHASHGNLAGTAAALSVTSLGAARAAMRKQKGIDGVAYIDPRPRFLVVPVALETTAEALLSSLNQAKSGGNTQDVEWIKMLTVIADPRLDESSATAWYLAADPASIEGVVRAFLAGEQRPYIEELQDFDRDQFSLKCRLDIGVGVADFRALYKNAGA